MKSRLCLSLTLVLYFICCRIAAAQEKLDTAKIEQLTGAKGKMDEKEGVFKVSVPRADLKVTTAGVKMTPPLATEADRRALIDACEAAGFVPRAHELVRQRFADDHADYYRKISLRGLSSLLLISDDQFARGLRDFAAYCQSAERHGPIYESVELFLFSRG